MKELEKALDSMIFGLDYIEEQCKNLDGYLDYTLSMLKALPKKESDVILIGRAGFIDALENRITFHVCVEGCDDISKELQELAFENGVFWADGKDIIRIGSERNDEHVVGKNIKFLIFKKHMITGIYSILYSESKSYIDSDDGYEYDPSMDEMDGMF